MSKNLGVRVGEVPYGLGVFATRMFFKGELIGLVEGEVIDDADYSSDYCMDLGGTLSLEPIAPFRYLNHSCEPNSRLFIIPPERPEGEDNPGMILEAVRSVRPGEELTIDYGWPAECAIPCHCQSRHCRGWIVAREEAHLVPKPDAAR
jgi:SET domain-containing protein